MKKWIVALGLMAFTSPVFAEARLLECGGPATVANVVEPWQEATRSYANDAIRIVHVDTGGEPVCCSAHLVILAPDPQDELGLRQCRVLSDGHEWTGFQFVDIKNVKSSYDASKGLLLLVPIERYVDGIESRKAVVRIRINQATGTVLLE